MKRWNRWNIFIPVKLHTFHYFSNCMYYRSNYTSVCQAADECVSLLVVERISIQPVREAFFACLMLPPTASILNIYYPIITRGPHRGCGPGRPGAHLLSSPVNSFGVTLQALGNNKCAGTRLWQLKAAGGSYFDGPNCDIHHRTQAVAQWDDRCHPDGKAN